MISQTAGTGSALYSNLPKCLMQPQYIRGILTPHASVMNMCLSPHLNFELLEKIFGFQYFCQIQQLFNLVIHMIFNFNFLSLDRQQMTDGQADCLTPLCAMLLSDSNIESVHNKNMRVVQPTSGDINSVPVLLDTNRIKWESYQRPHNIALKAFHVYTLSEEEAGQLNRLSAQVQSPNIAQPACMY